MPFCERLQAQFSTSLHCLHLPVKTLLILSKLTRRSLNSLWKIFSLNFEKRQKAIIYAREDQMALEPCRSVSTCQFYFQSFWTVLSLWSRPNSSAAVFAFKFAQATPRMIEFIDRQVIYGSIRMRGLFILYIIFAFLSDNT